MSTLGALKGTGTNVNLIEMILQPALPCKYLKIKAQVFKTSSSEFNFTSTNDFILAFIQQVIVKDKQYKREAVFTVTFSHWSHLKDFLGFFLHFAFFFPLISTSRD